MIFPIRLIPRLRQEEEKAEGVAKQPRSWGFPTDGTMPGRDGSGPGCALQAWEPLRVKLPVRRRISLEPKCWHQSPKVPPRLETGRVWTLLRMSQSQTQLSLRLSAGLGRAAQLWKVSRPATGRWDVPRVNDLHLTLKLCSYFSPLYSPHLMDTSSVIHKQVTEAGLGEGHGGEQLDPWP